MPTESPRPLARQLLRVAFGTPQVPDRDLLARFVAARDEDAFAELVRRHGPMVLGVCRRVTGRPHDAEDAFQAAFLVLARRAGQLTQPERLANWLYGVAFRTALDARTARRRAEERAVSVETEPAAPEPPDDGSELRRVIDEELARLPDKYRSAVVLCDLEEVPRAAAARQLGIPEGTLSSRLAHARKVLAGRLARRGVTASATAISAVLGRDALATVVPHTLAHTTVQLAVRFAAGGAVPAAAPPAVSSLTEGVLKTMLVTRLRQTFAAGLLTCGLIGVGGALAQQLGAPPTQEPLVRDVAADDEDPFAPVAAQPPRRAEPKKVVAKGVEDDDVPYSSFPGQAVVRIEDGKLIIRQRVSTLPAVTQKIDENTVVRYYEIKSAGVRAEIYDTVDVAVFDMKGNRLSPKAWKEMLKSDVHALIAHDGKLPNPRELTLFKADALLIVLPATHTPAYPVPPSTPTTPFLPFPSRAAPAGRAVGGAASQALPSTPAVPVPARPEVAFPPSSTAPAPAPNTRPAPVPAVPRTPDKAPPAPPAAPVR